MTLQELRELTGNEIDAEIIANIAMQHTTPIMLYASLALICDELTKKIDDADRRGLTQIANTSTTRRTFMENIMRKLKETYNFGERENN